MDADLLQELATTQMQADEGALFNQACPSPQQATQLEDRPAQGSNNLVTYHRLRSTSKAAIASLTPLRSQQKMFAIAQFS